MSPRRFVLALVALTALPAGLLACLWDYDTLKQERARFPDALELITGKYLRHSPEFYEWRIKDRLKKLEADPSNPALLDDLAVAYDKTGQHDKAIATMERKEKIKPGMYETQANMATFLFHAGKPEESLPYLKKALEINPDAHFGRERYQLWLTEYVLEKRKDGKIVLPLGKGEGFGERANFMSFLHAKSDAPKNTRFPADQRQAAIKGILGMMRFARHDSPILLEALGDLLGGPYSEEIQIDAKRLSSRAYLNASYEVKDENTRKAYRALAKSALTMQTVDPGTTNQLSLEALEQQLKKELEDAAAWYSNLKGRESAWIAESANPEAEFDKLYTDEPKVSAEPTQDFGTPTRGSMWDDILVFAGVFVLAIAVGIVVLLRLRKR